MPLKPPPHLHSATRHWWRCVVDDYELEPHHVRLLTVAARAWDEADAAADLVRQEGLTVTQPSGAVRPHPAIRIANEARALFMRALRELDLDVDPPATARRPPPLRSTVGGPH
jgi:P27 family predicted phage terminase small subunit